MIKLKVINRKRLRLIVFAALLTVTVAYVAAFYVSKASYEAWIEEHLQRFPEEDRPYVDYIPFLLTPEGQRMRSTGFMVCYSWVGGVFAVLIVERLSERKRKAVVALVNLWFRG